VVAGSERAWRPRGWLRLRTAMAACIAVPSAGPAGSFLGISWVEAQSTPLYDWENGGVSVGLRNRRSQGRILTGALTRSRQVSSIAAVR
jgi:hypothetical protein